MAKVYAMIADGTEEVECLSVVDILRRNQVETILVSVEQRKEIVSSHGIRIQADAVVEDVDFSDGDVIFLPGGLPGSEHLSACKPLIDGLRQAQTDGRRIAAICAAPGVVLGRHGFLEGKTATCFPGCESEFRGGIYTTQGVVTDGNITTARGLGFAIDLGLELVRLLVSEDSAKETKKRIQYD
ncbi:MAG: DJ-1/PfpI family protein [Clostridiales bacterium]|nr:DJ-1/PfpI family protein [Clostridiales bacterium]